MKQPNEQPSAQIIDVSAMWAALQEAGMAEKAQQMLFDKGKVEEVWAELMPGQSVPIRTDAPTDWHALWQESRDQEERDHEQEDHKAAQPDHDPALDIMRREHEERLRQAGHKIKDLS